MIRPVYKGEPYRVRVAISDAGAPVTGLSLQLTLLDSTGAVVAGPSPTAVESPAGTYTAEIANSQTAALTASGVTARLFAAAGGLDARSPKVVPVQFRPLA